MMRRTFLAATLLCAMAPAANAADALSFQLGWLPGGDRAPAYLALQRGLFAAENLDVKILPGRGSTDTITKLATGVVDVGEAGFDAFLAAKAEGTVPVTAVMPFFTKPPDALLTTSATGIASLKDIGGRSVATSPFTSSNLTWPVILKLNDVDPAQVKFIKADAGALGGMLAAGQVDAVIMWTTSAPPVTTMVAAAGKQLKILPWSDYGMAGYSQTIIASDKTLAERPDAIRRFVKVMRDAIRLTKADPMAAAEAVKVAVPQADLAALKAQVEVSVPLMMNEITARDGLGTFSPDLVRKTWEWVAKANNYPADKLDPMSVVSTKYAGS